MNLDPLITDDAVLHELGERLTKLRLDQNLTQAGLAEKSGVSKRTVERLESGEVATQLSGLVRVCRGLGILDRFDLLLPEVPPSPISQLRLQGRTRQRASGPKKRPDSGPKKWTWGDGK